MTPEELQSLADAELIEKVAVEVMGWRSENGGWTWKTDHPQGGWRKTESWNPLTNWGHWRQVEEKLMRTPRVNVSFLEHFDGNNNQEAVQFYIESDLRTRCLAALLAVQ